jgi:chromosome segregation ATPase
MRWAFTLGMACLLVPVAGWAASGGEGVTEASSSSVKVGQQLAHYKATVKRLETVVSSQEAASRQATQSLRKQDQKIAELQRQLQRLRVRTPSEHR